MRWSLVLSTFIAVQFALSFFCVALPIPLQSEELERRAPVSQSNSLKLPSDKYRKNAITHSYAYNFNGLGADGKLTSTATVTKEKLSKKAQSAHGNKLLSTPGMQADHVFEVQMLKDHLRKNNIQFSQMDGKLKDKVKKILNGPRNMAFIPASVNQSKGQLVKHGMAGKAVKPQPVRDEYAKKSYETAHETAGRLESVLKKHPGYAPTVTLQEKLKDTYKKAGLNPPTLSTGGSSSASSSSRSSSGSQSPAPGPSTPGPSSPNPGDKRPLQASPGKSPPKNKQRGG